ncbi:MAG: ROK family protein [Ktedonobacteraceae bacterium]|nr:ROK family protein [Ktedonobacteraceae bacterium]
MSTQPTPAGNAYPEQTEMQRITGKLLATRGYVVGIEINGSGGRQSVALADLQGTILHRVRRPLDYVSDPQVVLTLLDQMLAEVTDPQRLSEGRILRVAVAVNGLVDANRGLVRKLHHARNWHNFPLQDYFAEKLAVPCMIDNSANCAALAEVTHGVGQGEDVALYVGLGRGIGGGLVANGRIYHGTTSTAGEIGHMLVKMDGPKCSCGGFGHLEAIASAQAIVRTMIGLSVEHSATEEAIREVTGARAESITAEQVLQLAAQGDEVAKRVVDDVYTYLGIALANIVHIVNPSIIILGGPAVQGPNAEDQLLSPLRERVRALCIPEASESLRIVAGSLGSDVNLMGAVTLALQDIY